ncbi:ornithine cyclodeaminase family protein [Mariniluteicoccus flavus]
MTAPRWIDADQVMDLGPARARELLRTALAEGLDPTLDPARLGAPAGTGQLLVMPSVWGPSAGVKVASVSPDNPERGLPRIQALYVLMDAETLTPHTILDGAALTTLRTPAVSAVAIDALCAAEVDTVVIVGSGPQAVGHADAVLAARRPRHIVVSGRDAERARACASEIARDGVEVSSTTDRDELRAAVEKAQLVVCATGAGEPVIDSAWVADGACVVAVGSHDPDRRELGGALLGRSLVVIEDGATALREAGDVVMAIAEGHVTTDDLVTLGEVVRGEVDLPAGRPRVFKSVGMAWQDLVVADGIARTT